MNKITVFEIGLDIRQACLQNEGRPHAPNHRGNDSTHDSPHQNLTLLALYPPLEDLDRGNSYDKALMDKEYLVNLQQDSFCGNEEFYSSTTRVRNSAGEPGGSLQSQD